MRDYWLTRELLQLAGWTYVAVFIIALGLALWLPKRGLVKFLCAALVAGVMSIPLFQGRQEVQEQQVKVDAYKERYAKAKALFDERCKTAGEKIFRTVEGVEGIHLINARPQKRQGFDEYDQNWPGAGLQGESTGSQYILNFLFYDVPAEGLAIRFLSFGGTPGAYGSIAAGIPPKGLKGYRYVDVDEGGARVQYSLRPLSDYLNKNDPLEAYATRNAAISPIARYVVSYDNIDDAEGRANWIAGAHIKVVDRVSGDLLGEIIQFSFETGFGSKAGHRQPWAFARQCPQTDPASRPTGAIRYFVQKILKPHQGE